MSPVPPLPLDQMRAGGVDTVVRPGGPPGPGGMEPTQQAGPGFPDVTRRAGFPPGQDRTRRSPVAEPQATILERPPEARAWLVVKEGEGGGQWHPIPDEISIGRDRENNVVLIEGKVSRFHAKIRLEKDADGNDQFVVWDLASRNGTWVNGERVRAPVSVKENDIIKVGNTTFVLKMVA